ncbi:DUF429 domain-containing protein [Methylopila turkensis]|uniref:DUF429 domain-containing protein n=1 Tax=Methylopila turkensis TaxID=1437816 RepID=A0A9W6JKU6_9HYPH|nr:DUF429 domain-containing protein [Methylopila turkensis]GLK79501.1 hypothetical protein GCM10008174_12420 [Methylopila turkensis]
MATKVGVLIHADWSAKSAGRWAAFSEADGESYVVSRLAPFDLGPEQLLSLSQNRSVLAGFDFPIGIPRFYAEKLGVSDFRSFLSLLGEPEFEQIRHPAGRSADISVHRPFYPAGVQGVTRTALVQGHGLESFDALRRRCEQKADGHPAATPLFFTLGGAQVGRGAVRGWIELLAPLSLRPNVRFWPFDGPLAELVASPGLTIAETYPADARRFLGVGPRTGFSKTSPADRIRVGAALIEAATAYGVRFTDDITDQIRNGFGDDRFGSDRFDAVVGLIGMAAVLRGQHAEGPAIVSPVEGWILGRVPSRGSDSVA